MSDGGIDLQPNIQTQGVVEINLDLPVQPSLPTFETDISGGAENGGLYFDLGWQNSRAEDRRQQITLDLSNLLSNGEDTTDSVSDTSNKSTTERRDFSDSRIIETDTEKRPSDVSTRREILEKITDKTTPVSDLTANILNQGEVYETPQPVNRTLRQFAFERGDTASSAPENKIFSVAAPEILGGDKNVRLESAPTEINLNLRGGENASPAEENTFGTADVKIPVIGSDIISDRKALKDVEYEKASKGLPGNAPNILLTENGASRSANNSSADTAASVNAATRRTDGGTAVGGALISGALTTNDNYKNLESRDISRSHFVGNAAISESGGKAAGATGVMMSAAIGSIVPNSEAAAGGVLGSVSGVVVGVEADQGLRWLGENPAIFGATADRSNLLTENSYSLNLNAQTRFA